MNTRDPAGAHNRCTQPRGVVAGSSIASHSRFEGRTVCCSDCHVPSPLVRRAKTIRRLERSDIELQTVRGRRRWASTGPTCRATEVWTSVDRAEPRHARAGSQEGKQRSERHPHRELPSRHHRCSWTGRRRRFTNLLSRQPGRSSCSDRLRRLSYRLVNRTRAAQNPQPSAQFHRARSRNDRMSGQTIDRPG